MVTFERLTNRAKFDLVMLGHQIRNRPIACTLLRVPTTAQHIGNEGVLILMQSINGVVVFCIVGIRVNEFEVKLEKGIYVYM